MNGVYKVFLPTLTESLGTRLCLYMMCIFGLVLNNISFLKLRLVFIKLKPRLLNIIMTGRADLTGVLLIHL